MSHQKTIGRTWAGILAWILIGAASVAHAQTPFTVWYMGDVAPAAPDSAGPGVSFELFVNGTNNVDLDQGQLVYDPAASDYKAWYVSDTNLYRTRYRSIPNADIQCGTGSTIVGRVRVPYQQSNKGANLAIYDGPGTAGHFWAGVGNPDGASSTPGRVQESYRDGAQGTQHIDLDPALVDFAAYHILRLTVRECSPTTRVVKLYFDEDSTPVWTINQAIDKSEVGNPPDSFGFGTSNTNGLQKIYFDWVTASNRGAFGPGEEVAVLGQSLVPTVTPPACELNALPDTVQAATAVIGQAATPAQIPFTVFNSGQTPISYTVTKVPDDESTAWLTLDPASGGPLSTGNAQTVNANINPAGLDLGTYSAQLRFSGDCGSTEVIRTVQLTVTGNLQVTPKPGFSVPVEVPGPQTRVLTVTNVGASALNYQVVKLDACDWLTLGKTANESPIPSGGTDAVTATVDPSGISSDQTCRLLFTNIDNPAESAERTVMVDKLDNLVVLSYWGDVPPGQPNSFQPDHTFSLSSDDVDQGELVDDPAALDGKAWRIQDGGIARTRWYSQPNTPIDPNRGATIIGRMAVESIEGGSRPGNVLVKDDDGLSVECHFAGPHTDPTRAGRVSESIRQVDSAANPDKANQNYHLVRVTVIGGPTTGMSRTIRIYLDEQPAPALEILGAIESTEIRDQFGFGVGLPASISQTVKFDYVRATTVGAFAPGAECAVLGECLAVPEMGACCQYGDVCTQTLFNACDGIFQGVGISCDITCPRICRTPFADADNDKDVDQDDFGLFQACFTGEGGVARPGCRCFDRDDSGSGDVDLLDLASFEACARGPSIAPPAGCEN